MIEAQRISAAAFSVSALFLFAGNGCLAVPTAQLAQQQNSQEQIVDKKLTGEQRFERLRMARNDEYERERLALFADPEAVAYLPRRFGDADPVVAFVARELHLWATQRLPEFDEVEEFLAKGIYAHKEKREKTAAGWQPHRELASHLERRGDKRTTYDYLLLRMLMRPKDEVVADAATIYYASVPVSEPEVWIRIALEIGNDGVYEGLAEHSLRITEKSRTLRALNYERARVQRLKAPFPAQLEELRNQLMQSRGK